jgi:hypothetical protein
MKLIVNADDFGLTLGVSKGIIEGMKLGSITDTSVLTNSPYFYESIDLAKKSGITTMGVHLTITFGYPILDYSKVESLVDKDGYFHQKYNLKPENFNLKELYNELVAQIEIFLSTGMQLNHLDTHHGFSILSPEIFKVFIKLSEKYQVPLRRDINFTDNSRIINMFQASQIKTTDHIFISTTHLEDIISELDIRKSDDKTFEIACHPGWVDEELQNISSLTFEREKDLEIFFNEKFQNYIKNNHIELTNYSRIKDE